MTALAREYNGGSTRLRSGLSREKRTLLEKRLRRPLVRSPSKPSIPRSNAAEGPLSFSQQRLWFLEQLEPGQPVYHVPVGLRLRGPLDCDAAAASLAIIVERHQVLRTAFRNQAGTPVQVVTPARRVQLPMINLQHLQGDAQKQALTSAMAAEAARPFDLTRDLLIRAVLFRLAPKQHVLLLTMHHIACDAWSIGLLLDEWGVLYKACVNGNTGGADLPRLPIQYLDYALWQRQQPGLEQDAAQLGYWKRQLGDKLSILELPADRPRPPLPSNQGRTRTRTLSAELSASLSQLAYQGAEHRQQATKFMTMLAAFKTLLHRYSGQDDIVVGSPISRRTQQETEHLIGLFLNLSVLRTNLSGDPTFRELLERIRQTALQAYVHQNVPSRK